MFLPRESHGQQSLAHYHPKCCKESDRTDNAPRTGTILNEFFFKGRLSNNFREIDGETVETVSDFILGGPKSLQMVAAAMKLRDAYSWKESYDQPR